MNEPRRSDGDLLAELAALLAPEPVSPQPAAVDALRRTVVQRWSGPASVADRAGGRWRKRLVRWTRGRCGRGAAALTALAAMTAGGSSVAFAAGVAPEPVRAAAYAVGLPVDSPALSSAKHEEHDLQADLRAGARSSEAITAAAAQAQALARRVAELNASDRRKLGAAPYRLLGQARELEAAHRLPLTPAVPTGGVARTQSSDPPTTGAHPVPSDPGRAVISGQHPTDGSPPDLGGRPDPGPSERQHPDTPPGTIAPRSSGGDTGGGEQVGRPGSTGGAGAGTGASGTAGYPYGPGPTTGSSDRSGASYPRRTGSSGTDRGAARPGSWGGW